MSLLKLPALNAASLASVRWEPRADVMSRWDRAIQSSGDENSTINIYDPIGSDGVTAKRISAALRSIGSRDVTVSINSPGGDFFEGITIYNLLRGHPHKVTVQVVGLAASAASVIAMAGDEIKMSPASFMMIHNAWSVVIGNSHDLRAAADVMAQFDESMASLYASRTGIEQAKIAKLMDAETFLSGESAFEMGFATALLPDAEPVFDQQASPLAAALSSLLVTINP